MSVCIQNSRAFLTMCGFVCVCFYPCAFLSYALLRLWGFVMEQSWQRAITKASRIPEGKDQKSKYFVLFFFISKNIEYVHYIFRDFQEIFCHTFVEWLWRTFHEQKYFFLILHIKLSVRVVKLASLWYACHKHIIR